MQTREYNFAICKYFKFLNFIFRSLVLKDSKNSFYFINVDFKIVWTFFYLFIG